ncbi:MAG TPA: hypothetical protein VFN30_08910 [Chitinophagaceae bacterium]|nr:hypothetical protein [Chitinophagaceae bacterium]
MKYIKQFAVTGIFSFTCLFSFAQDTLTNGQAGLSGRSGQIIPDKIVEIAIPLLAAFLILNFIANVVKKMADNKLKSQMIEKGISEETLVKFFKESNQLLKLQPLKWFLFSFALALSFITIYLLKDSFRDDSGYLPLGIILLFFSAASIIYYRLLSKDN